MFGCCLCDPATLIALQKSSEMPKFTAATSTAPDSAFDWLHAVQASACVYLSMTIAARKSYFKSQSTLPTPPTR